MTLLVSSFLYFYKKYRSHPHSYSVYHPPQVQKYKSTPVAARGIIDLIPHRQMRPESGSQEVFQAGVLWYALEVIIGKSYPGHSYFEFRFATVH